MHRKPKPFAFIEFINYDDAKDAKKEMDRRDFQGRQIDVVFAQERRKSSDQMRSRDGPYPVCMSFQTKMRLIYICDRSIDSLIYDFAVLIVAF